VWGGDEDYEGEMTAGRRIVGESKDCWEGMRIMKEK
jgi:hypothetical protein